MPRLDHAAFRVADLDRAIRFYERVLPATLVGRAQHSDRWRTEIASLRPVGQTDFTLVLLMPRRVSWLLSLFHRFVPRQTRSAEHLGFAVDTLEELEARAEAARSVGARIENPITKLDGREAWLFEVLDPDGNGVEWICGRVH
ncbi:MAG: VOC family protein [Planctomycetes bacterium]|nr:VOC family protein [Planctomycetota bacterium]MCB9902836.1 VOC family protein [Planctomycetota bacterium]